VVRAVRRATAQPGAEQRAEKVLAGLHLLKMDDDIFSAAARLEPRSLRSLDALHLASALSLGADLGAIVIYDSNMSAAAKAHGLQVLAPGSNGKPPFPSAG
jgi:predicted nucleic acid-binding protein